jgi:hypothetical protein
MSMNRTETTSFQMQSIEIESLYEQLKKEQEKRKLLEKAFIFLQGEIVGKQINTQHPNYPYYTEYIQSLNK